MGKKHKDGRNLETIPTGALGIIPLKSCSKIGEEVDRYIIDWREDRQHKHENDTDSAKDPELLADDRKYHIVLHLRDISQLLHSPSKSLAEQTA